MSKFQNKYRIESARMKSWDYANNAFYFVTICTKNREHYFGDVINGIMQLSDIGRLVEKGWLKTPEIRPDMNLKLDAFVVMPNHFHAIILIGENIFNGGIRGDGRDAMHRVSTTKTSNNNTQQKNNFGPQCKNLSSIIRGFKSAVTIHARKIHADYAWQPRFYDHVIRNDDSYQRIKQYIIHNPDKWEKDKFNIRIY